jgi:dipeptidyl aminopeptidase/acylaminoacyl peptidase
LAGFERRFAIAVSRRSALTGLFGTALFARYARGDTRLPDPPPLLTADYAVARQTFKTRLTESGPSPDEPEPLKPPPGAERISYRSGELELAAWVTPGPGSAGVRPALLFLHGGDVLGEGHWDLTLPYRRAGYRVLVPALRGENGLPGAYSGFYDENNDVLAAAEALAGLPGVDRNQVFVAGHSMGGTQTLLAALSSKLFRGAAAFSGSPNAWTFFKRFPEMVRFDTADEREFEMRSAVCFAASFKCPVRIFHGSAETRLKPASVLTAERARKAGLDVETASIPGDHFSALPEEIHRSMIFFNGLGEGH